MKKKTKHIYISEKLYLDQGAWTGKKKIIKIEKDGEEIPFRQIDEYGRFEFLLEENPELLKGKNGDTERNTRKS